MFLCGTDERIRQIRGLTDQDDLDEIRREAHTLLGTAGNFGALRLSKLAVELMAACDAGDQSAARRVAVELTDALNATSAAMRAWLNDKRPQRAA